ncbi:SGNH/GDSL hydrolase family protein [Rhizobium paknamense]|uniref:SGNH hydrolase-type esterase domain-containing protein n=1 Tax=Rhizobium paknamense TaxID=1206817 RepID=A0ABU0IIH3_9HYPH|nr:DUF459 domain-containing protein [Rhizobium paknamense]MDQ0458057.1 hypothetical protein [Rhizobium paknamense]
MTRSRLKLEARDVMTMIMALALLAVSAGASMAQDYPRQRRTLLDFLFGRSEPAPRYRNLQRNEFPTAPQRPRRKPAASPARAAPPPVATPETPPAPAKLDKAQKILVIGDFFASSIGDGLAEAFRDSPGTVVEVRSNGSSGLVRDDYFDWQKQLPKMLDEVKPALVVIEVGANDRQQMTASGGEQRFPTDGWFSEYERRVDALARKITDKHIPLIWAGLPPVKSPGMSADLSRFNALYRKSAERLGGEFVDLWDGFVDQDGAFVLTGSDVNGQQVRLRGPDGISMTDAGKRKMAFYLEKSVRKLLGAMASPGLVRLDLDNPPSLPDTPLRLGDEAFRTPPMKISDPALDGGDRLLGGPLPAQTAKTPSPRDLLVTTGIAPDAPSGRLDDFRLPSIAK